MASAADTIVNAVQFYEHALDDCLILNAARNILSPEARALLGRPIADGDWSGRVRPDQAPYSAGPLLHLAHLDQSARSLVEHLFHSRYAEFRAPTGSVANGVATIAMTAPQDEILVPPAWAFGHKSVGIHGYPGCARRRIIEMPWDASMMQPDLDALRAVLRTRRPRLIILGTSRPLFPEPFADVAALAHESGSRLLYDGAHVLGLIAMGAYPNPLSAGFDAMAGSTQKTLPGPLGGLIVCVEGSVYETVAAVADQWLSTYSAAGLAVLAYVLAELVVVGAEYGAKIVENAQTLARSLAERGFHVIGETRGFTTTHQVLVDVTNLPDRTTIWMRLAEAGVLVNAPSYADRRVRNSSEDGIWLRLGTALCTRLGMDTNEMIEIADILARLLIARIDSNSVRRAVSDLCRRNRAIAFTVDSPAKNKTKVCHR